MSGAGAGEEERERGNERGIQRGACSIMQYSAEQRCSASLVSVSAVFCGELGEADAALRVLVVPRSVLCCAVLCCFRGMLEVLQSSGQDAERSWRECLLFLASSLSALKT